MLTQKNVMYQNKDWKIEHSIEIYLIKKTQLTRIFNLKIKYHDFFFNFYY
jgi:hypothetical protein